MTLGLVYSFNIALTLWSDAQIYFISIPASIETTDKVFIQQLVFILQDRNASDTSPSVGQRHIINQA